SFGVSREPRGLGAKVRASARGQLIELRAAVVVGKSPVALDPSLVLEAMESEIERAVFHGERVVRRCLDPAGDAVAVARTPRERFEDQRVERSAQDLVGFLGHGDFPGCSPGRLVSGAGLSMGTTANSGTLQR